MEKNKNIYQQKKIIENDIEKVLKEQNREKLIKRRRRVLSGIIGVIIILGILNISSISYYREGILNKGKYCLYLGIGSLLYCILSCNNYKILKNKKSIVFIHAVSYSVLLFLWIGSSLFPSLVREINGATGWLDLGFITVQPAELLKVGYIILLAHVFSKSEENNSSMSQLLIPSIFIWILFTLLIILENDLGTAIHYFCIFIFMLFFTKFKDKWILRLTIGGGALGIGLLTFIYRSTSDNYRFVRVKMFLDGIIKDNYIGNVDEGYQVAQSLLAFGNGGILGRSYGAGVQKYNYLPEIHTDFIMALFGEELGFIGIMFVILLFFLLYNLILEIGLECKDSFGRYIAIGVGGFIITQFLINFFVALGLLPVFGIPMPLFSYGGSSIMTIMVALGIVASINNRAMFDKK
ncbi:MAG: FtsW/RodA/SpoVE family cell cycle protein [Fusobacterium sp. JB021]|nr:FtsW/RodA/SpoVE family cell cycle protein [Fusobacterium sp. JB020]MDP0493081.1 FtsW/RodA/SpoVE family cell cycle protein [Fusobacterium sp. JB021]MDP0507513.1 FtsW/RodA/SpoVE family cell cycle protein [Fusobacterium sp. JB019]